METIELKEYGSILKKRIGLILLCVLIACSSTAVYSYYFAKPIYQASAKLIVNKSADSFLPDQPLNLNDINANILLVNTYKEILLSSALMEQVAVQHPELDLTAEQLMHRVSAETIDKTQVITLTVKDPSYKRAALIVNSVSQVFKQSIPKIMNIDNVEILNSAKSDQSALPIGNKPIINMILSFIVSMLLASGIALFLEYLDDTIKTVQDVERTLGLPTYAAIRTIKAKDFSSRKQKGVKENLKEAPYATVNQ